MELKLRKKHTFNSGIASTMLIIILISLFVLLGFICTMLSVKQWDEIKSNAITSLNETSLYINAEIDSYLNNSITLATNPELISILNTTHPASTEKRIDVSMHISNFFDMIPKDSELLLPSFVIYTNNPTLYSSPDVNHLELIPNENILRLLQDANPAEPVWQTENDNLFIFYLLIDTSMYTNILRVQMDDNNINSFVENTYKSNNKFHLSLKAADNNENVVFSSTLRNKTQLYSVIPLSVRKSIIINNIFICLSIYILLGALLFFIIKFITEKITKDIYNFIDNIDSYEILTEPKLKTSKKYVEFEIIENKIIDLLTSIKLLHNKLDAAEKKSQEIELEAMQSKFNPHLLYNTLSAVKWSLMRGSTDTLSPLIDLLTNYYRTVLNQQSLISLDEEIQLIQQYVSIMNFAHSANYKLTVEITDDLESFGIMKHTLQPLVENAILHGINRKDDGIIKISAYKENDKVIITIFDNGYGMTEEKIAELETNNYNSIYKNYGIRNTKNRLFLFFGKENFTFTINSKINSHTEIKLTINNT